MGKFEVFKEVKDRTNGYLAPEVYEEIYRTALTSPNGIAVDIGPAQGGSSISIGLGAKEAKNIKQIYSIDVFAKSAALKSYDNVEENVKTHFENVKSYGLESMVQELVVGRDQTTLEQVGNEIALLFIDADGALDRDFEQYYNRLLPNAAIILDDCENEINLQCRTRFLKWQTQKQVDCFLESLGIESLENYTALGKQYTTYQFLKYFEKKGYLTLQKDMDGTVFARKPIHAPTFTDETKADLKQIRYKILEEFEIRHQKMKQIYESIGAYGIEIAKARKMNHMMLFENYDYVLKNRKQTVKVFEWHKNQEDYLENDMPLQDICFDKISEFVEPLEQREAQFINIHAVKNEKVKQYLEVLGVSYMELHPIFIGDYFWGCVFCYANKKQKETERDVATILEGLIAQIQAKQDEIDALSNL